MQKYTLYFIPYIPLSVLCTSYGVFMTKHIVLGDELVFIILSSPAQKGAVTHPFCGN